MHSKFSLPHLFPYINAFLFFESPPSQIPLEAKREQCQPKVEREGKLYPPTSNDKGKKATEQPSEDDLKKGEEGKEKKHDVGHAVRNVMDSLSNLAKWQNLGGS